MARFNPRARLSLLAMSTLIVSSFSFGACSSDPFDPQTWIDKLDDAGELEEAITTLERLRCPEAIKPLGKVWEKHNRWSKVLRVIIKLADQPEMVKGHPKFPNGDCPDAGEGPYWEEAIPFLIAAVEEFDVTDEREIQDAAVAAEALGKAKSNDAVQVLISAATKKEKLRQGQMVRIAAVKALGGFGDNKRTVDTIVKVLKTEAKMDTIRLNAAAANALAATRSPSAIGPLIYALYEISPIYQQIRTALTTIGKPVVPELLKIFNGTHAEMNKYAEENKFATKCDVGSGPGTTCVAPGNLRFKSASLLGDLRDKSAVGALTKQLSKPEAVSFFDPKSGAPGPSDHNAILDALRKMGAFGSAPAIFKYIQAETTKDTTRPLAIDAYSMLAKDTKALPYLQKTFEAPDTGLRQVATLAYARLATSKKHIAPIQEIIDRQLKSAKEADAKGKKSTSDEVKNESEGQANDFRGFAREYEQHRTRARAGVYCKGKPTTKDGKPQSELECYQDLLRITAEEVVTKLSIPNHRADPSKPMKKQDMQTYRIAALERALLEVAKMGKAAEPAFEDLLKHAESTDRIVRQGVLLALVQVAPSPCDKCVQRLQNIITSQKDQTTLDNLTSDTRIVMNYFISNGAKMATPGTAPAAAPDAAKKEAPAKKE